MGEMGKRGEIKGGKDPLKKGGNFRGMQACEQNKSWYFLVFVLDSRSQESTDMDLFRGGKFFRGYF